MRGAKDFSGDLAGSNSGLERTPGGYARIPIRMLLNDEDAPPGRYFVRSLERQASASSSQQQQHQPQPLPLPATQEPRLLHSDTSVEREGGGTGSEQRSHDSTSETEDAKRRRWTKEEDNALMNVVAHHGPKHWNRLAEQYMPERTGQQLRLRYTNHLRFSNAEKYAPFSAEQDARILQEGKNPTRRWIELAREMGRSHNAIKNRYNLLIRRQERQQGGSAFSPQ
ncbi:Transcriptional activator Myb [Porphyridium purpureum]|uniref:Transcriptional activator Myb n=1 Tax=Porphyridium purpureum TaxID=35688 RepID=A0A5J4YJ03_PORPP|nr:Transcriptional activator Myb [Porphyridium purpureum]|eukprot:POR6197..scf291_13